MRALILQKNELKWIEIKLNVAEDLAKLRATYFYYNSIEDFMNDTIPSNIMLTQNLEL